MYQYGLANAQNHYMGFIQTETVSLPGVYMASVLTAAPLQPYFQPDPAPTSPFVPSTTYYDPSSWPANAAWGLYITASSNIIVFGACPQRGPKTTLD